MGWKAFLLRFLAGVVFFLIGMNVLTFIEIALGFPYEPNTGASFVMWVINIAIVITVWAKFVYPRLFKS